MSVRARARELAKVVLRIQTAEPNDTALDVVSRGESVFSSTDTLFVEDEPTVLEWFRSVTPSRRQVLAYPRQLFPFTEWIGRYNLQWLYGDLVAGKP
jgi:sodium-independent sulfate anion transporter 11